MKIRVLVASTVVLAPLAVGCGGKSSTATIGNAGAADGCPAPADVHLARWRPGDADSEGSGAPALARWDVPLGYVDLGWEDPVPPLGPTDEAELRQRGLTPLPPTLLLQHGDAAPCVARVVGYDRELVDIGPRSVVTSARLAGCELTDGSDWALGWTLPGTTSAESCRLVVAKLAGTHELDERSAGVTVPPAVPPPAAIAPAVARLPEPAECGGRCARLWRLTEVPTPRPVYQLIWTWILPGAPDESCNWDRWDHRGLYATGADGAVTRVDRDDDSGADDDRPIMNGAGFDLVGALVDRAGVALLLGIDVDRYAVAPMTADGLGEARGRRYFQRHEEDSAWRSLAPYCGP